MTGLALRLLRHRPGSATATLIALSFGVLILTAMGSLVEAGLRHPGPGGLLVEVGASFGGYVVLLVVFVVAGIIGLSVRHRRRDLALLRAVAATPGQVRHLLVAETLLIGAVAAALGLPAGALATLWLRDELTGRGFVPASVPVTPGPLAAAAAVVTVAVVAVAAALVASRRATAIRPVEALGEVAVEPARLRRGRLWSGVVLLALGVAAGGAAAVAGGQAALTSALGMLYLTVGALALLAPWINRAAAGLLAPVLRTVWGASGHLAAANLRANARGTATVLTALVLSVGFGGSVWFVQDDLQRATVAQTRAGMLAQQVVLAAPDAAAELRRVPGVRAAVAVRDTSVLVPMFDEREPVPARAVDPAGVSAVLDPGVVGGSLDDLGDGRVAVSQMEASTHGWQVGGRAAMWQADGTPFEPTVVAIYTRSLAFGDVIMADGSPPTGMILVRADPGTDLTPALAGHPGAEVVAAGRLTGRLATDLTVSAWLNKLLVAVMVGYAVLAAADAMILAALSRGRELATLRLAGATRRQVGRMVHAEQAALLGGSVLIGGVVAAGTLVAVAGALTGSFRPYVPVAGWVAILAGTTLLAMATTILPIRHLLHKSAVVHT